MATKRYRKGWAKLMLAASLLLSLATAAEATVEKRVNGLSASDLLNGGLDSGLRVPAPEMLAPRIQPPARIAQGNLAQDNLAPTDDTFSPLSDEEIRQQLLLETQPRSNRPRARPVPASSFLTPTAYGADWGDAYIGLAQVTEGKPADSNFDGSAAIGFGFGDAIKNVGLETSVSIISLNGFAEDGIVGFKLHKIFPEADNLAVALGWSNPIKWGAARQREDNFYGVVTKRFELRPSRNNSLPLTASLGLGTGTFRSTGAIAANNNAPNVFGSVGLSVIPEVSLITSWTGSGLNLAASTAPLNFPLVLTLGVSDLTDNTVEGPRFHSTLGYSYSF
ncbi:MAG: hypothetical protein DCF25_20880 [Leptolyngbya foveolarum]|uniref:Transporter n=1 Tax=Leptolyngbya foveolarum TaxID=47253 RepID=A0A2W4TM10_9CYAN|nr:MAG: hypothetical protein DCF25_20880 [Leptolyngbya foveolarum]